MIHYLLFQVNHATLQKDLFTLEKQERAMNLKFGVIYAKSGQFADDEFFSNEKGSLQFENFLDLLGEKIVLKGKKSRTFLRNLLILKID